MVKVKSWKCPNHQVMHGKMTLMKVTVTHNEYKFLYLLLCMPGAISGIEKMRRKSLPDDRIIEVSEGFLTILVDA